MSFPVTPNNPEKFGIWGILKMKLHCFQIQRLMDLPTTLETAELGPGGGTIGQAGGQAQPVHRVKSMFQQVTLVNLLLFIFILLLLIALHLLMMILPSAVNWEVDTS